MRVLPYKIPLQKMVLLAPVLPCWDKATMPALAALQFVFVRIGLPKVATSPACDAMN
jgi:hypothetical protein